MVYRDDLHFAADGTRHVLRRLAAPAGADDYKLPIFMDGARLAMALGSELDTGRVQRLCRPCFTPAAPCGALFGEALVISNKLDQEVSGRAETARRPPREGPSAGTAVLGSSKTTCTRNSAVSRAARPGVLEDDQGSASNFSSRSDEPAHRSFGRYYRQLRGHFGFEVKVPSTMTITSSVSSPRGRRRTKRRGAPVRSARTAAAHQAQPGSANNNSLIKQLWLFGGRFYCGSVSSLF